MYQSLETFRENHGLQSTPGNVFANITKETIELRDEVEAGNELGIVCELCDHVIYPINILEALGHDAKSNIDAIQEIDCELLERTNSANVAVTYIMFALANYNLEKDIKALALIARIALKTLCVMGYNAEKAVLEKCKTINSREGSYNTQTDKWEKLITQDKSTLYKPDYLSCRK